MADTLKNIYSATPDDLKQASINGNQAKIIEQYLKAHNNVTLEELEKLQGIGQKTIEKLQNNFSFGKQQIDQNILTLPAEGETSAGRKTIMVADGNGNMHLSVETKEEATKQAAVREQQYQKFINNNHLSHLDLKSGNVSVKDDHLLQNFKDETRKLTRRYGDRQKALEHIAKKYDLNVEYNNNGRSMMDRILGRNKFIDDESLLKQYSNKANEQVRKMIDAGFSDSDVGKISENGPARNKVFQKYIDRGGLKKPATSEGGSGAGFNKLKWAGRAGAVVGLLALGGVIGNMFSGGHKSNAELYNPNPQPQYYS